MSKQTVNALVQLGLDGRTVCKGAQAPRAMRRGNASKRDMQREVRKQYAENAKALRTLHETPAAVPPDARASVRFHVVRPTGSRDLPDDPLAFLEAFARDGMTPAFRKAFDLADERFPAKKREQLDREVQEAKERLGWV